MKKEKEIQKQKFIISQEAIQTKIFILRGKKIILDRDLAFLYGVPTKVFNQSVKRNIQRFPEDFMFQLNDVEFKNLRSQIVTSNWGGQRYLPYAFTEQGIAMLSGVLNSERAIQVNIQIMRTFIKMREMLLNYKGLKEKIENMEKKYNRQFKVVFEAIRQLLQPPKK